jgi:hypothetical protein
MITISPDLAERELAVVRDELKWRSEECGVELVAYPRSQPYKHTIASLP